MKYCQGPKCHTYQTKDRLRGPKGAKYYQTRKRSQFYNLGGNACSMICERDWFDKHGQRAIDHFGRIHEPIILTEENAWIKDYDYDWNVEDGQSNWHWLNTLTKERRPLTEQQYNNPSLVRP